VARTAAKGLPRSAVAYDVDGIDPYGREVCLELVDGGWTVSAFLPFDAQWRPAAIDGRYVLPGNRGSVRWRQALRQLYGPLAAAARARTAERFIIVWTRGIYDTLVLLLFTRLERRVVVIHNPPGSRPQTPKQRLIRRALIRSSRVQIVHTPQGERTLEAGTGRRPKVVPHVAYAHWLADHKSLAPPRVSGGDESGKTGKTGKTTALLIGRLRPDKGGAFLCSVIRVLDPAVRAKLQIHLAGKGTAGSPVAQQLERLGVACTTHHAFLTDSELAEALRGADFYLAPYQSVSQSGSVALAVDAGLPVLATDVGGISLLTADPLLDASDVDGFAKAFQAWIEDPPARRAQRQPAPSGWCSALE
jgi:glycosyltransferase involved in cell wall biosynthesis